VDKANRREVDEPTASADVVAGAAGADPARGVMAAVPIAVRWGDLDALNHVNNAQYLVYVQEARLAWLANLGGAWFTESVMPVVAATQFNYRRQLAWPSRIVVELRAARVGNTSLTIAHRIVAEDDADCVYCDGDVVMVWVDPANGRPVPLPDAIRAGASVA
jgi:acyl-CoA thioester hydrolase